MRGVDLLIHDAQYTAQEYPTKMGWGHSPVDYVVKLAELALVKRVALTHHDPCRDDDAIDRLIASMRQTTSVNIFAAREGQVVELEARPAKRTIDVTKSAEIPAEQKLASPVVLLQVADPRASAELSDALRAESIPVRPLGNIDAGSLSFVKDRPALAIIEHDPSRIDGIAFCGALRQHTPESALPILLVAKHEDTEAGTAVGVSDWLIKPFTTAHVRTKVRTGLLRNACNRIKHRSHVDETRPSPMLQPASTDGKRQVDKIEELVRVSEKASAEQPSISSEKADLLWMYCRKIAAFDTPAFNNQLGRIIAEAPSTVVRKAS
jgi:DNA-binding response OmpR family regulator